MTVCHRFVVLMVETCLCLFQTLTPSTQKTRDLIHPSLTWQHRLPRRGLRGKATFSGAFCEPGLPFSRTRGILQLSHHGRGTAGPSSTTPSPAPRQSTASTIRLHRRFCLLFQVHRGPARPQMPAHLALGFPRHLRHFGSSETRSAPALLDTRAWRPRDMPRNLLRNPEITHPLATPLAVPAFCDLRASTAWIQVIRSSHLQPSPGLLGSFGAFSFLLRP